MHNNASRDEKKDESFYVYYIYFIFATYFKSKPALNVSFSLFQFSRFI